MGEIIDTYFKFGYGGDCYLGKIFLLKDANSTDFASLPAHWMDSDDPLIATGIEYCYPGVLARHGNTYNNPTRFL